MVFKLPFALFIFVLKLSQLASFLSFALALAFALAFSFSFGWKRLLARVCSSVLGVLGPSLVRMLLPTI